MSRTLHALPAAFWRGGTSKAVMFRAADLPADRAAWPAIFCAVMGSPDHNMRQLDGMGGGLSSLSKVCVVGPPSRPDAALDYTFVQVSVDEALADFAGNCGNMSAAIAPFALAEAMLHVPEEQAEATIHIHNTNTHKIIRACFPVQHGQLAMDGDFTLDGVAGSAAPIRLEFLDPGGAKTGRLLPTGEAVTWLHVPGRGRIATSCVDAANPCVFVAAADIGLSGGELPAMLERDTAFQETMEAIRLAASVAMGLAPDMDAARRMVSIPKVAMVSAPHTMPTLAGETLPASAMDLAVRMISVGQPHRAVPITGAVCLAVAARVPGSIPHRLYANSTGAIRIGHPSGTIMVDAEVTETADGITARHGAVFRSARPLFAGQVFYRL